MNSIWKQPNSSPRQQELSWYNLIFATHDQFCHCQDVNLHILLCMNKFNNWKKPEPEIRNIKCLLTGKDTTSQDTTTAKEEDDGGFQEGELEKLFEEGPTEDKDTVDTAR